MNNDKYLTIVTNQVKRISRNSIDTVGDELRYVKYKVDGVSSLAEVPGYEIGGKTFLHINGSVDIPLSIIVKAYTSTKKPNNYYENAKNLF